MSEDPKTTEIYKQTGKFHVLNTDLSWLDKFSFETLVSPREQTHNLIHLDSCFKKHQLSREDREKILEIQKRAESLLIEYGYPIQATTPKIPFENMDTNIEGHYYFNREDSNTIVRSKFGKHSDSRGGILYDCHSVIWYLEHTFPLGGELEIFLETDSDEGFCVHPRMYNTVLLNGSTMHAIKPMIGIGRRRCIVVQVKAKEE